MDMFISRKDENVYENAYNKECKILRETKEILERGS